MHVIIAYRRVSTDRQGKSGLGLAAQTSLIENFAQMKGTTVAATYEDIESGGNDDRRELARAIEHAKRIGGVLVVATLDRLSRDLAFIANLMKSGLEFRCADMPTASTFELHIRAAIGEEERRKISERTRLALCAAKAKGVVLGGYRGVAPSQAATAKGHAAQALAADARARALAPIISELRAEGHNTLDRIARALTHRGITSPRGGKWSPIAVSRIERRSAALA
jgi:DNA invertase Pin-like site-specific DNA recombinase